MTARAAAGAVRSPHAPAVVGVADHNGWAVLVTATVENGAPAVVDRRRVALIAEGVPSQPYHHETLTLPAEDGERLLRVVRRSIAACTARAFDALAADLSPRHRVVALTIRQPPLEHMPAALADVHASYHVTCRADGMLYHTAVCDAARQRAWEVVRHPRGHERVLAAAALRTTVADVDQVLDDLKQTLGAPWTAEHRAAFAAALAALAARAEPPLTRLRGYPKMRT